MWRQVLNGQSVARRNVSTTAVAFLIRYQELTWSPQLRRLARNADRTVSSSSLKRGNKWHQIGRKGEILHQSSAEITEREEGSTHRHKNKVTVELCKSIWSLTRPFGFVLFMHEILAWTPDTLAVRRFKSRHSRFPSRPKVITTENSCILLNSTVQPVSGRCVFMEMKQIELELAYVGYVKKKKKKNHRWRACN